MELPWAMSPRIGSSTNVRLPMFSQILIFVLDDRLLSYAIR